MKHDVKKNTLFAKFLLLWSGELISAIGSGLSSFGLGVYVFQLTGSASAMTLVMLLGFLPSLLLAPLAGILADRYDRRLMMILGDSLSATGLVFILVCMLLGEAKLWQICVGVTVSAVFSSLLEPAYKATVTDLLSEDEYSKASGLVQIAGSSKFLISPVLAGVLMQHAGIELLLILDICTFLITVTATIVVRRGLASKRSESSTSFLASFKEGWRAVTQRRGVMTLILLTSLICFCMGFIQTLSTPMILAFSDTGTLGAVESMVACGMLVSSVVIGVVPLNKKLVLILTLSLFVSGVCMALFALKENLLTIGVFGFLFFASLPFANTCLEVLVRKNIDNALQGRAWGLIGVISQMGYVVSYALAGPLSDHVFTPLLLPGGALSSTVGRLVGTGEGRGAALLILLAGVLLSLVSLLIYASRDVRGLEKGYALEDR
ncbi:MAG: MFS transporter [Clostridia bacterium]|nr:MFS transporter [Clostridia bacterium]